MKVLRKASLVVHGRQAVQAKTERQILEEVRHPFIVKLCYAFQTPLELHMILEYAVGGELFRHLDQGKKTAYTPITPVLTHLFFFYRRHVF